MNTQIKNPERNVPLSERFYAGANHRQYDSLSIGEVRSQYQIRQKYFDKYKNLPSIDNLFIISIFADTPEEYLNLSGRYNLSFRQTIFNQFVEDCGLDKNDIWLKKTIQNIKLSELCSRYVVLKAAKSKNLPPHEIIFKLNVSKTKDINRQNLLKKFINWYAGKELHTIN